MAFLQIEIKHLDGETGYHRWKELMLLRLRTLNISHVLFDEPPTDPKSPEAANWARMTLLPPAHPPHDHTLSKRLFDLFHHHVTSKAIWMGLQRMYELDDDAQFKLASQQLADFRFDESSPILVEMASFDSIAAVALKDEPNDLVYCQTLIEKLPVTQAAAQFM